PLRSAFFCRIWKITSCFFIVPKFSIPISLAMVLSSAMDIACSWLMLIVFPSLTSARGVAAGSTSSITGALAGGRSSSEERVRVDSSGAESAASSGKPSKTSFFFALPLGLVDFFATRGIDFGLLVGKSTARRKDRSEWPTLSLGQPEGRNCSIWRSPTWADQGRLIKNQYG